MQLVLSKAIIREQFGAIGVAVSSMEHKYQVVLPQSNVISYLSTQNTQFLKIQLSHADAHKVPMLGVDIQTCEENADEDSKT